MSTRFLNRPFLAVALALALPLAAWAQDDDDDFEFDDAGMGDDDDDAATKPKNTEDEAPLDVDPTDDDEWAVSPESGQDQLEFDDDFEDDGDVQILGPGQDTARIYREQLQAIEDIGSDEESLAWERYLRKYPNSVFRARIDTRMEELAVEMFDERVEDRYSGTENAGRAELNFGIPMSLESIDPRSKIRAGFEMGFPSYFGLQADMEYQIKREFSVHGGIKGRYTGMNLEIGGKYALIKSARTQMLVTVMGDFRLNFDPLQPALRPILGVGKRFGQSDGVYVDAMLQGGTDLVFVKTSDGDSQLSVRETGGLGVTIVPSPTVHIFVETSFYMKGLGDEDLPGDFIFNTFTFGLKFIGRKSSTTDKYEVGLAANAPYATNYWAYHFGAVSGDINYFL